MYNMRNKARNILFRELKKSGWQWAVFNEENPKKNNGMVECILDAMMKFKGANVAGREEGDVLHFLNGLHEELKLKEKEGFDNIHDHLTNSDYKISVSRTISLVEAKLNAVREYNLGNQKK